MATTDRAPGPPDPQEAALLKALSTALAQVAGVVHAQTLAELGEIDLPDETPSAETRSRLEAMAPLYLAAELEAAGLLRAAEVIAGLFASGAITQPLGAAAERLHRFWQRRRERLDAGERNTLLQQAFETRYFEPLMARLCAAIVALADNGDGRDLREEAGLGLACRSMLDFLGQRAGGMVGFAAGDIVPAIDEAVAILREPALQAAFAVRDLWSLAAAVRGDTMATQAVRNHVARAKAGSAVLHWLIHAPMGAELAGSVAADLIAAAERWRLAGGEGAS